MKVSSLNGCKVYNLSSGKTFPQWLSESKKKQLAKDEEYRKRLEIIQDFEMATAAQCISMTKDGEHIIVTGTYPPVVRCYTTSDLAMKFQRGLTCDVISFTTLSEDYSKIVFLQSDRTLSFHAPYGKHYNIRIPKFGRDMAYNWDNCDLYLAAAENEIYRLNLETGQFKEPFTTAMNGCNKIHLNPVHNLLGCGGEKARCEFWDPRMRRCVSQLIVDASTGCEVTALNFDTDGLTLSIGTSNGNCLLYDIRSKIPIYTKEHQYGLPIINIQFHNASNQILSTDKKIIKIWDRHEPAVGQIMTNIETPADINDVHVVSDRRGPTGMVFVAGEQSRIMTYFIPQLGPAPRWCSFLEGLTEELEETSGQSVYEDFKFLTRKEIEELGASSLIGTPVLKGYMHGFFMEMKLFSKLRAVSKPFEYEEHRKRKIREKLDSVRGNRITIDKRLPKVNKELAMKMIRKNPKTKDSMGSEGSERTEEGGKPLIDARFKALFEREDFQQDEAAYEYQLHNPTKGSRGRTGGRTGGRESDEDDLKELYDEVEEEDEEAVEEEEGEDDMEGDEEEDGESEEGSLPGVHFEENENVGWKKRKGDPNKGRGDEEVDEEEEEEGPISRISKKINSKTADQRIVPVVKGKIVEKNKIVMNKKAGPKMFELSDAVKSQTALFAHSKEVHGTRNNEKQLANLPISERLKMVPSPLANEMGGKRFKDNKIGFVTSRTMSYMPARERASKPTAGKYNDDNSGNSSRRYIRNRPNDKN